MGATSLEPTPVWETISTLCSSGHTPQILTGIILRLCVHKFADARNIDNPMVKHRVWKEDYELTQIQIQPVWFFNTNDIQRRPGIYVKRGSVRYQRIAMNDGHGVDMRGAEVHSVQNHGTHVVGCCGGGPDGGEADAIASEIYRDLQAFAPVIRRDCKLSRFSVMECGEVHKIEEAKENFVCPVVIYWAYLETYKLVPEGPKLKTVSVDVQP